MTELTPEQRRAVQRRDGSLLLSAGAGTGKTTVLVERFVAAVVEDGVAVEDVLAITFTEKAAAQLGMRLRTKLAADGTRDQARAADSAWLSTIHGFCARVLRTHALAAGLDPEFRVLDGVEAERLGIDAFDRALAQFLGGGGLGAQPERLRLVVTYTPDRLRDMVRTAYAHLRSRGEARPELPEVQAPRPAGEREALAAALAPALAEIGAATGRRVDAARARVERCAEALERLGEDGVPEPDELDELAFKASAKALAGEACERYRGALDAYRASCVAHREYLDHVLLRDLIRLYGERYAAAKRERSGLDFDDLELIVADLLVRDEALRDHYAGRFAHVLVDELQDVNPVQDRILGLLERNNLFRVGDERQSIYRFRHADVGLFRTARSLADERGRAERLTVNFRSREEVLDAVDLVFGELWGEGFDALRAPAPSGVDESSASAPGEAVGDLPSPGGVNSPELAPEGPCVELLCVDRSRGRWEERFAPELERGEPPFGAALADVPPWRAAEARLLARRVDELTRGGRFAFGDVALLLRASTDIGVYERALTDRGIPTHVIGGRGYFSQQQVGDLRAWLAALANPLDELALHSVLASPLVSASLDALVLVAACARRMGAGWDVWRVLEALAGDEGAPAIQRLAADLPTADADRLRAFVELFREERVAAARVSLETLIDRAVTRSGYDRALLAQPGGERRMANVRKLMRLAREFEAEGGRDLRGFIDLVAERDLIAPREGEAPLEAEQLDAVRLMTIHRAKGLEFPVVCVADLGKAGREDDSALRVTDDGRVGMRLASLGGGATDSSQLGAIRAEARIEDEEEERRVFYVAMTRAREHLICSGATDLEKRPEPKPLEEPMRWLWRALVPNLPDLAGHATAQRTYDGRPVDVRCEVLRAAEPDELLPRADREPQPRTAEPPGLDALQAPALAAIPVPRALPVSRLSYSGLERYRRCGYRFYLERALRLPRVEAGDGGEPADGFAEPRAGEAGMAPAAGEPDAAPPAELAAAELSVAPTGEAGPAATLSALARGSIVHELLERLDFARPTAPDPGDVAALLDERGEPVRAHDVADLVTLVERFVASPLCARIGRAERIHSELPFAFTLESGERSLLVNGIVDLRAREPGGVLVVDYKSDRLGGRDPVELTASAYETQRLVYALAALRGGADCVEVAYCFLERPGEPVTARYEATEADDLERGLAELASGVIAGRFEPSPNPHRALCGDCPGRASLCSWGWERTLAEEPGGVVAGESEHPA